MSGLGDTKGGTGGLSAPRAGADPSLERLANDVKILAQRAHSAWGDVSFNRTLFDRLKRQAAQPASSTFHLTAAEAKQFVTGTVIEVTAAYVKAHQLATLPAPTAARRNQLMAAQRQLSRTARAMLDAATRALDEARPQGGGSTGTSGLGFVCGGACIAAIAGIAVGVSILIAGALVYSWAQSGSELRSAMLYADRICQETPGGCDPQQRAALVRGLRMPDAVTAGVMNITSGLGEGLKTVVIAVGIGSAVSFAAWAWLRFTPSGRRLSAKMGGRR